MNHSGSADRQVMLWDIGQLKLLHVMRGHTSAVAALAYRAREGLRQAFLQAHVNGCADEACRDTVARLGGWTRDRLSAGLHRDLHYRLSSIARHCRPGAKRGEAIVQGPRSWKRAIELGTDARGGSRIE